MEHSRIDVGTKNGTGWFTAGFGAAMPTLAKKGDAALVSEGTPARPFLSRFARMLRNAAIAVAVMTLVPIGLVSLGGDHLARVLYYSRNNVAAKVAIAEPVRAFRLASDPSITPMQAGIALNALQPSRTKSPGFTELRPATQPILPWQTRSITPEMFPSAQPRMYVSPMSTAILEAAAKGFSPAERDYLRALATAPVWREFDLVARASSVDVVGGQFRIPFGPEASPEQRPLPSFKMSRELANAAVSRAAYHMSIGQRDSAEAVLRSIVSFGFAMIDNGSSAIEDLIGAVVVGIGRDGLQRFYAIQHDPRATLPALNPPARSASTRAAALPTDQARRRFLLRIADTSIPIGQRLEDLQSLSVVSCTNVRELLLGPRADVTDALEKARRTIPRFPSEQALVELQSRMPFQRDGMGTMHPIEALIVSASSVAGTVLQNPRLATCARIAGSM